jgi:chromosome segregation ATPase
VPPEDQAQSDTLDKRLSWLDDQRRKDADLLRKIGSQLKTTEDLIGKHTRQLQELSGELTRLAALAARIQAVDETLGKHRQEVSRQLEASEARRTEKEKGLELQRRKDHDEIARGVSEMRQELRTLADLRRDFQSRMDEDLRLARSVAGISEKMSGVIGAQEEQARNLTDHEDVHKQDARRSADTQAEVGDLRLRVEGLRGSLDIVEDRIRQAEIRAAELEAGEVERRETTASWMESENLRMADMERVWGDYARRFEAFEKRAAEIDERVHTYDETHRALRQLQIDLEKTLGRLERKISEVSEVQRLGEDRHKQEWTAFLAEDQRRWGTFKLSSDEQNQEHSRQHQRLSDAVGRLEDSTMQALQGAITLEDSTQRRLSELLALLREWAGEAERRPARVR